MHITILSLIFLFFAWFPLLAGAQDQILFESPPATRIVASRDDTVLSSWNIFIIGDRPVSFAEIQLRITPRHRAGLTSALASLLPLRLKDGTGRVVSQAVPIPNTNRQATVTFAFPAYLTFGRTERTATLSFVANTSAFGTAESVSVTVHEVKALDSERLTPIPVTLPRPSTAFIQSKQAGIYGLSFAGNPKMTELRWRGETGVGYTPEFSPNLVSWTAATNSVLEIRPGEFVAFIPLDVSARRGFFRVRVAAGQPNPGTGTPSPSPSSDGAPFYPQDPVPGNPPDTGAPFYPVTPGTSQPPGDGSGTAPGYP